MEYCKRCLYPANARPTIILDDEGVCSGCRYHESRQRIDWSQRERMLRKMLEEYKEIARKAGNPYDCIIPVGGGKDSHYQTYLMKEVYGMNPLLVTYNHTFNTRLGIRNLNNMVKHFGCDLIRFTTSSDSARKLARHMTKKVGDLTWHYHAGIRTVPFQVATKWNIPLVIWGEHGFAELTGMVTLEDMVEYTNWTRKEMDMRGIDPHGLIGKKSGISLSDIGNFIFPSEDEIDRVGVRGIYLSNFVYWDAKKQAEFVAERFDFEFFKQKREKTFILHGKTDDHANDVHDYLKYLKFGYGRGTDDASMEIRHGRMTREEGIELVNIYDHVRPKSLDIYLDFIGYTEKEFNSLIAPMRDPEIWEKDSNGVWCTKDSVANHTGEGGVDAVRVPLVAPEDRTFSSKNKALYYSEKHWMGKESGGVPHDARTYHGRDDEMILL